MRGEEGGGGIAVQYEEKPIFVGTNRISIMANRSALELLTDRYREVAH